MSNLENRFNSALDKQKLKIWGYPWGDSKKSPILGVRIINNNVRLESWLNHPEEATDPVKSKKAISANMDPVIFETFKELLGKVIRTETPCSYSVVNNTVSPEAPGSRIKQSEVKIVRTETGVIYIELDVPGRPTPRFPLLNSQWYNLTYNGEPMTRTLCSTIVAKSWLNVIDAVANQVLVTNHVDERILRKEREEFMNRKKAQQADANTETFGSSGLPETLVG